MEAAMFKARLNYNSFPFKGKVGMGMGLSTMLYPIPSPTLPLKGREQGCNPEVGGNHV
jgi:hypothetical protein